MTSEIEFWRALPTIRWPWQNFLGSFDPLPPQKSVPRHVWMRLCLSTTGSNSKGQRGFFWNWSCWLGWIDWWSLLAKHWWRRLRPVCPAGQSSIRGWNHHPKMLWSWILRNPTLKMSCLWESQLEKSVIPQISIISLGNGEHNRCGNSYTDRFTQRQ